MVFDDLEFVEKEARKLSADETKNLNKTLQNTMHTDVPLTVGWICHDFDFAQKLGFTGSRNSKNCFNSICIDALKSAAGEYWVSYSRNNQQNYKLRYGSFGYSIIIKSIEMLLKLNFIKTVIPHCNRHVEFQSVFKGSESFLSEYKYILLEENRIEHIDSREAVRLKRRKSRILSHIPNTDFYQNALQEINLHNHFIDEFDIQFNPSGGESIGSIRKITIEKNGKPKSYSVDLAKKNYSRVFIDNFGEGSLLGGRYYGSFLQGLSKCLRSHITINGETVGKEIDYSCMHPRLCYAQCGILHPDDWCAYQISFSLRRDIDIIPNRKFMKTVLNALFCSTNSYQGIGVIQKELLLSYPNLYENRDSTKEDANRLLKAILKHHAPISHFINSDAGVRLQFLDSQIMTQVHQKARNIGVPVLSIHDSILYPENEAEQITPIFFGTFNNYLRNMQEGKFGVAA